MSTTNTIGRYLARYKIAAAILYAALVIAFLATTALAMMDMADRQQAVAASADILSQLERRAGPSAQTAGVAASPISGSPFLEDTTITVAGATLLQHLAGAVSRAGGTIVSSQVDLEGPLSNQRFISATASCELQQPALQQLLYDLETGMPFVYVDKLQVEAPTAVTGKPGGPLHVSISVSAQWQPK
jgi:general secretion pathway protein M